MEVREIGTVATVKAGDSHEFRWRGAVVYEVSKKPQVASGGNNLKSGGARLMARC